MSELLSSSVLLGAAVRVLARIDGMEEPAPALSEDDLMREMLIERSETLGADDA